MTTKTETVIKLTDIGLSLNQRCILHQISLRLHQAEIVTLIGPNGAGKSTLVKIILGLQKPTEGTVQLMQPIRFGYMPQKLHIDSTFPLTVMRFLELSARKLTKPTIREQLSQLHIGYLESRSIHHISGGEFQRVMLARALLRRPNVLILDEPAQGLDVAGQQEFYAQLDRIRQDYHCSILLVSHDLHWVMAATDRVICINQHVCCSGCPESVSQDPAFQALYGQHGVTAMALYNHHHDHEHRLSGCIEPNPPAS